MNKSSNNKFEGEWISLSPFCKTIPELHRPHEGPLNKPVTRQEQLYCWFFWIEAILNPSLTRYVLDELDNLPEFSAPWGQSIKEGSRLKNKTYELIVNPPKKHRF